MERAFPPAMRTPSLLLPLLALAACGDEASTVSGDLAEGAAATHVWLLGEPARAEVASDSFRLESAAGEVLDLRFADGEEEVARMEIRGAGAGEGLRLRGIWFDDGVAHPSAVEGGGVLTVNGLRMGAADRLPASVDAAATVLAVSDEGDALIVRPGDEALPDLRVVVTPGTRVATADGDPASAEGLEFGDSVRVVGESESGYVIAAELIVPRERARGEARGAPSPTPATPSVARREAAAEERKGKGEKRGREGRGKGKGRG